MNTGSEVLEIPKARVILNGGVELTPEQAKEALDLAMRIIETVGTTGIYRVYREAHDWMSRYYPNWA